MQRLVIATRASPLALWQAEHVQRRLMAFHPGLQVELLRLSTRGDEVLDRSLSKIGGKGLFVKELEVALLEHRADLAVHSFKDLPMQLEAALEVGAVMQREDPRDCFVSARCASIEMLETGARVGTSSLRRELALRVHFPHLQVHAVRGNVGTRLAKLDRGEFDALIMAAAGLKRLGLGERIRQVLPTELFLPAPSQGALAVEIRSGDRRLQELLTCLEHTQYAPVSRSLRSQNALIVD